jgi:hypothetical protein
MITDKQGLNNRRRTLASLAAVSLSLLTACAPMTINYYRPEANAGNVVKAWCPPVHSFVLIDAHDVIVGFKLSSPDKEQVAITMTLEIPEKHTVRMLDRFVEIDDGSGVIVSGELTGQVWVSAGRLGEVPLDKPMQGSTEKKIFDQTTLYGKTEHAYFMLSAEIPAVESKIWLLKPPVFFVDGIQVELPAITFIQTEEKIIGSLNC